MYVALNNFSTQNHHCCLLIVKNDSMASHLDITCNVKRLHIRYQLDHIYL